MSNPEKPDSHSNRASLPWTYTSPLTTKHLQAIGQVITASTLLEGIIEAGIWGFLSLEKEKGLALTTHMKIRQRWQTLGVLAHHLLIDEDSKREIRVILDQIDSLRERR